MTTKPIEEVMPEGDAIAAHLAALVRGMKFHGWSPAHPFKGGHVLYFEGYYRMAEADGLSGMENPRWKFPRTSTDVIVDGTVRWRHIGFMLPRFQLHEGWVVVNR